MTATATLERLNRQFRLKDGRQVGFAEYGDPGGVPIIYCHGWPSSRLEPRTVETLLEGMPVRVIAPDRPGYGLSDFQTSRRIDDWPNDVSELADHLGLKKFAVLGVSGGGPYSIACAARIPERVSAVGVVSGLAPLERAGLTQGMVPLNRRLLNLARVMPWSAQRLGMVLLQFFWREGNQVIPPAIEARLSESDRRALESAELREGLIAASVEALRGGFMGPARDGFLYARPWGFSLRDIKTQIRLWHGEKDVVVPPVMGHYLAEQLPNCRATFTPDDGHFSLPYGRIREVLESLLAG